LFKISTNPLSTVELLVQPRMFERFYQRCPKCGQRTWKKVMSKKLIDTKVVQSTRRSYSRSGNWPVDEPVSVFLYSYDMGHKCRACGNQWTERVTKQRPW